MRRNKNKFKNFSPNFNFFFNISRSRKITSHHSSDHHQPAMEGVHIKNNKRSRSATVGDTKTSGKYRKFDVPPHPYGVLPEGNKWLNDDLLNTRDEGLGDFAVLIDQIILAMLEWEFIEKWKVEISYRQNFGRPKRFGQSQSSQSRLLHFLSDRFVMETFHTGSLRWWF